MAPTTKRPWLEKIYPSSENKPFLSIVFLYLDFWKLYIWPFHITYVNEDSNSVYETLKCHITYLYPFLWTLPCAFMFLTLKSPCKTGIHADYSLNKQWKKKWCKMTLLVESFLAFPFPEFSKPLKTCQMPETKRGIPLTKRAQSRKSRNSFTLALA